MNIMAINSYCLLQLALSIRYKKYLLRKPVSQLSIFKNYVYYDQIFLYIFCSMKGNNKKNVIEKCIPRFLENSRKLR